MYDRLESITAWFPVRGVFLGERPMSRRELDRIAARLQVALDSAAPGGGIRRLEWARRELALVTAASGRDARAANPRARVLAFSSQQDLSSSNASAERFTANGLGTIDAATSPFESVRQSWKNVRGTSYSSAFTGAAGIGNVAVIAEPRFMVAHLRGDTARSDVTLYRAYARATFWNVALRVGRDEQQWGQSPRGSLFVSRNAAPFSAISVGTDTPITLPWLFRFAGPMRGTAILADLGRTQDPPHAKLAGWQLSVEPWSRFELGVAVLAQTGGSGGPPATFLERVIDLFPVIDAIAPQHSDLQISNKLAGGNLRLRIPELSGLDFYYELQIDDFDARRLKSSLLDDAGHLLGARLPLLVGSGQLVWRAEWHRTSIRLYEHTQFRSGVSYRGRLIGDPLGPHAKAGYLSATWQPAPERQIEVALADEGRDPSQYVTTSSNSRDEGFRFVQVSDDPHYRRRRATASFERSLRRVTLRLGAGYDRAWREGIDGSGRDEWIAHLTLRSDRLPTF